MPEDLHENADSFAAFIKWLSSRVQRLVSQLPLNKCHVQDLLLATVLTIRDLEFVLSAEQDNLPKFLRYSTLQLEHLSPVEDILASLSEAFDAHVEYVESSICGLYV